ncbi:hypothetical protein [Glaesserella parasuis]|uniref:hypothetical protein n=2 Tax=Glaesserella parasuis TaxID=738 RepID=UPI0007A008FE|nr:hypothetical protein [Glaesserella parasuis]AMW16740.1 hypothetical protein A4U84_05685 [Glaesserella parasuis]MDG6272378.1 hypothetical protein [Glaesserella parasuis]MDG6308150.1 hypothetical protein [Glaesserella parasuis]MDG6344261.1 hypothetical protein [Glaesserella parasuis]MDP0169571.1 hypothetical protein [Glaesserella parasuis]
MLSQGNNRLKEGNMWITLFKEKGVDLSKNILVTSTYNEKRNWCGMLADICVITNVRNELTNNLGVHLFQPNSYGLASAIKNIYLF